jgi:hypothetical protein
VGDDLTVDRRSAAPLWPAGHNWTRPDIGSSGRAVGVQVAAAEGAGYQRPGRNGETFPRVTDAGTDFDLVVLLGSRNDNGAAADVHAGVTFVDPPADGWSTGRLRGLIGADDVHPTDEGHRYLADLFRLLIDGALPAPS